MAEKRNKAAEKLVYILPKYLYNVEKSEEISADDKQDIR